jgi:monooxygenase
MPMESQEHFDILIIGAGIPGIDAAYRLQAAFPRKTYSILGAREAIGGTWALFRYPGVRSDSDMHTLGFPFRPWHADEAIADGPAIWNYIRETATRYGTGTADDASFLVLHSIPSLCESLVAAMSAVPMA